MNWYFVAACAVLLLLVVLGYNGLVRLRNEADTALSGIDVQLKRRADLIPNLVETVKGYAAHESSVLEAVTRARAATLDAHNLPDMEAADRQMEQAVGQLMALGEAYPDLKASANFEALQSELSDTEDKVAAARRYYNAVVQRLNTRVESVPTNILARLFGFGRRDFFRVNDDAERQASSVSFSGTP
jgi:LemA protein